MYVGLSKEHEALRDELRAYYDELLTPEVEEDLRKGEGVGRVSKDTWKKMAADGYAGVGWPKEWGGRGLTPIEQFVFFDESMRAGAPVPMLTINSVAPTIMRYGSDEQKEYYVPKILKGEIHFAIGYTEPDAGTDLASLKTRAVRDGDEYVINGQKVFTSLASGADYIWLAVRTNQEAKKHKGISIIIVPTDTPGFRYVPIDNFGNTNTNITYYEDVRVPVGNLVGEENGGWRLITTQLNNERVMLGPAGRFASVYDRIHAWASKPGGNGVTPIDHEDVRRSLGEIHAIWRINELLNWQVAAAGEDINVADAAATKVFGTERVQYVGRLAEEIVGKYGNPAEPETAELLKWLDSQTKRNLVITFGGGVNEVMREMIAASGLKVPRVPR